jgi:RNA polymerase sigma factor (TIGR02999 family)
MLGDMADVTQLLDAIEAGDPRAAAQLLPLVYDELRRLAAAQMTREQPGQTLDATALVHEAYLRLVGDQQFTGRGHFFAAAAEAMRRILIDRARRRHRHRHGGGFHRVELRDEDAAAPADDGHLLALDEALTRLAGVRAAAAGLVQLRFFAGLTVEEAAPVLGVSPRTARRLWVFARAWLRREMDSTPDRPS